MKMDSRPKSVPCGDDPQAQAGLQASLRGRIEIVRPASGISRSCCSLILPGQRPVNSNSCQSHGVHPP